ncbi:hypothetical protein ACQEV2_14535 [Streptomyces sp. CA-251387]|uniref:hypothetical protein n=1 Tax=Streptomyces sp. CA-251387 TaxID=3240064 RepID=UPI003D8F9A6E
MRSRGVLVALFLLPLAWGLVSLASGRAVSVVPECPGLQLDDVGEEHPGRMRPGFTCAVGYDNATGRSTGTRTYDQQKFAQETERDGRYLRGAGYLAYSAVGLTVLAVSGPLRLLGRPRRRREAAGRPTSGSTDTTGA